MSNGEINHEKRLWQEVRSTADVIEFCTTPHGDKFWLFPKKESARLNAVIIDATGHNLSEFFKGPGHKAR